MSEIFNYKELIEVEFAHDYYKKGKSNDFIVMPTHGCQHVLKKTGLLFRNSDYGFKIYGDCFKKERTVNGVKNAYFVLKKSVDTLMKFTFLVKLQNPYLLNFSELPVQVQPNVKYYFNNLTKNISANNDLYLVKKDDVLSGSEEKYVSEEDQIQVYTENINWLFTSSKKITSAELRFIDSGISVIKNLYNNDNTFPFQFDLSGLPAERFDLHIEGDKVNSLPSYNFSGFSHEDVYAIIEIFCSQDVPDEYRFLESQGVIQGKKYIIPFHHRKTIWRYIIMNNRKITLKQPAVMQTSETGPFAEVEPLIFESGKLLPLREESITGISFRKDKNDSSSEMFTSLPNPSSEMIRFDTVKNKIYSDVYINI